MFPAPYGPPRIFVALFCVVLSVGTIPIIKNRFVRVPVVQLPKHICSQCISDLRGNRPWSVYWLWLLTWGIFVSVLHFGGLEWQLYPRFWWWDIMTHLLSGAGVAGILLVGLRNVTSRPPSLFWVLVALVSIGAGFEVYEYVFRSFWHSWTMSLYGRDTLIDLVMGCFGGALALVYYRSRTDVSSDSSQTTRHAQPND